MGAQTPQRSCRSLLPVFRKPGNGFGKTMRRESWPRAVPQLGQVRCIGGPPDRVHLGVAPPEESKAASFWPTGRRD
jgi:hypothetical protein